MSERRFRAHQRNDTDEETSETNETAETDAHSTLTCPECDSSVKSEGAETVCESCGLVFDSGLLSTPTQVAIILVSVVILVEFHAVVLLAFKRLVGDSHPLFQDER